MVLSDIPGVFDHNLDCGLARQPQSLEGSKCAKRASGLLEFRLGERFPGELGGQGEMCERESGKPQSRLGTSCTMLARRQMNFSRRFCGQQL